jgi:prevent-host-death family protein
VGLMRITTTEIQNNFGKYLKLSKCEDLIITKNGTEVARLIPYQENRNEPCTINESSTSYCPKNTRLTYDEFLIFSEESENRYEYIDGELYLLASTSYPHQKAIKEIFLQFGI